MSETDRDRGVGDESEGATSRETASDSLGSIAQGASFFAIGYGIENMFKYTTNLLLTRLLGPAGYGIFSYAKTLFSITLLVSDLGSTKSLMRYLPANEDDREAQQATLTLAYGTSLFASAITAALLIAAAPTIAQYTIDDPIFIDILRLFALIAIFDAVRAVASASFRSLELSRFDIVIRKVMSPGANLLAAAIAFVIGLQVFEVVALILVGSVLTLAVALGMAIRYLDIRPSRSLESVNAREYYSYTIPLATKDLGWFFYTHVDVLMVGVFFSAAAVGTYQVAVLLTAVITFPMMAMTQLYPPIASKLYSRGAMDELETLYKTVARWSLTASFPLATGAIIYAPELLMLFGDEFVAGASVLGVLAIAKFVDTATGPTGYTLMMTDHQYLLLINQWSFALLNIGLNYAFILEFGVIGAAYASALVLGSLNLLRTAEIYYLEGIHPFSRGFIKPIVAIVPGVAAMVTLPQFIPLHPILAMFVAGGIGCLVYAGGLALLGLETADREMYNRIR